MERLLDIICNDIHPGQRGLFRMEDELSVPARPQHTKASDLSKPHADVIGINHILCNYVLELVRFDNVATKPCRQLLPPRLGLCFSHAIGIEAPVRKDNSVSSGVYNDRTGRHSEGSAHLIVASNAQQLMAVVTPKNSISAMRERGFTCDDILALLWVATFLLERLLAPPFATLWLGSFGVASGLPAGLEVGLRSTMRSVTMTTGKPEGAALLSALEDFVPSGAALKKARLACAVARRTAGDFFWE
eukprot:scaffold3158_cov389-Prasinococcus_capsulatus_cf.AAC.1